MALVSSEKSSNAATSTSDNAPEQGEAGKLGYTMLEPTGGPATSNKEIKSTKGTIGAVNNEEDGTSMGSYSYQKGTSADSK